MTKKHFWCIKIDKNVIYIKNLHLHRLCLLKTFIYSNKLQFFLFTNKKEHFILGVYSTLHLRTLIKKKGADFCVLKGTKYVIKIKKKKKKKMQCQ